MVQDETELFRWFEQDEPYTWMVEKYRPKYGNEPSITRLSNFRRHLLGRRRRTPGGRDVRAVIPPTR